jgi:hypothetical protein
MAEIDFAKPAPIRRGVIYIDACGQLVKTDVCVERTQNGERVILDFGAFDHSEAWLTAYRQYLLTFCKRFSLELWNRSKAIPGLEHIAREHDPARHVTSRNS